jgi:hypothetical protein
MLATIAIGASIVINTVWIALRRRRLGFDASVATYTPR